MVVDVAKDRFSLVKDDFNALYHCALLALMDFKCCCYSSASLIVAFTSMILGVISLNIFDDDDYSNNILYILL